MNQSNNYTITPEIRNFVVSSTKLHLIPYKGVLGYNHLIQEGASKRAITSDTAFYLLLSDLNKICAALNENLTIKLPENKFCALVSYFHSKHALPDPVVLAEVNLGQFTLASERLFQSKTEPLETRALRLLELKLWNNETSKIFNINNLESIGQKYGN